MRVERLSLRNFRNIAASELHPDPKLNFLLGKNGQGKTSFLEALGYLSTLRSFRGSKTADVIRWGCSEGEVSCLLAPENASLRVVFASSAAPPASPAAQRATKAAFINGKPYKSSTQYLSQRFGNYELGFHSVVFNPSDHDLVRSDPATRRSYLDRVLSAEDRDYLETLQKYHRVVDRRNALLKAGDRSARALLQGFSGPMSRYGAELTHKRLGWIERLREPLDRTAHQIAPDQPSLNVVYVSVWVPEIDGLSLSNNSLDQVHFTGHRPLPSLKLLEQAFLEKQVSFEAAEWKSKHSLVGPHRDDWAFYLGGRILKGHGSQGEVRSSLLALKLSEVELFREATGHRPIFLLDDFSSELDRERRAFLLEFLREKDLQVFVTTTDDSAVVGKGFWVVNGALQDSPAA